MQWVFGIVAGGLTAAYRSLSKKIKAQKEENKAIKDGLLAILHDRLYQACTHYIEIGHIDLPGLKNVEYLYKSYHALGGNGTGTELYTRAKGASHPGGLRKDRTHMIITGMAEYESVCKNALVKWYNSHNEIKITLENVFVVWACKTLQNYKALLSTTVSGDGIYAEYTYNGDKQELYEDVYGKLTDQCIKTA